MERKYTDKETMAILESLKMCKPDAECDNCVVHDRHRNGCISELIRIAAVAWEQQIDRKQCAIDTLARLLEEERTNGQF